ncbi:ECF-type riboflavin transporter substrate-binding protein [Candidatus Arthromitus sp. SFB-turkey]|uniref:ECF-type riboflavin transporter substrate-binding protein n=1 Tax=Candidatus Arthromitus sp. SFB-turkey TaxID=1840217 RepID=UPI0007F3A461|nr:ECF-type riboflavin transporter substrate-binding protein [Candidatus Arthromitus sp. SFB-turkey]OAT89975.1 hypothetical protein A6P36_07835 [Candidatus Arthromitus sp. SFB-turkey]HJC99456.1 ECF-type riboflavin transporter substrate-binding protein [Candidatus Dwaynia gallinarum]
MRNSSFLSIKNIVAIGIGSAVFLVLGRFGSIPTGIPNTNLEVAYAFLALMAIIYGPVSGFLIGFIGHALKDMLFYGTPWFSWVIASAVVGLIVGLSYKFVDLENFNKKEILKFNFFQILGNVISWLIIAPTLDILIYSEPSNKVFIQGAFASISNILTIAIIGTSLVLIYSKSLVKKGSLSKES